MLSSFNIAQRLKDVAQRSPDQRAVVVPAGRDAAGRITYAQVTFRQLDDQSDRLAHGLKTMGAGAGTRLVLMVPFGIEFVSLVFASFKAGAVIVLIDPGMGLSAMIACLEDVDPEGFLAIPRVHVLRMLNRRRFPNAKLNLTVGPRMLGGGRTYRGVLDRPAVPIEPAAARAHETAAVIFTSGSTGPPKGVIYEHGMFNAQVDLIRDRFALESGGLDLSGFPLFGLFNAAMGVTTVVPPMNPSRPARANAAKIVEVIDDQATTQSFGSPALWNRVCRHCEQRGRSISTVRKVLSAGAPVSVSLLERMVKTFTNPHAEIHTPYGATEALPVSSISAAEVIEQTAARTRTGAGTCVGKLFPGVAIKIIEIDERPIPELSQASELPAGQIGEIIVQGPSVTRRYLRRPDAEAAAKIADKAAAGGQGNVGEQFWHRMGDVGYLDEQGRLWYCGRKSQILTTSKGRLFTEPCEAIFNEHPRVFRSALVGLGTPGTQLPAIIVEPQRGQFPLRSADRQKFSAELRDLAAANPLTREIHHVLFDRSMPVDVRHNSKINRERLALWAANALHGRI